MGMRRIERTGVVTDPQTRGSTMTVETAAAMPGGGSVTMTTGETARATTGDTETGMQSGTVIASLMEGDMTIVMQRAGT